MRLHSDYPFWMISEGLKHSYPTLPVLTTRPMSSLPPATKPPRSGRGRCGS